MGKIIEKVRQRQFDAMLYRKAMKRLQNLTQQSSVETDWTRSLFPPRHPDSQHQPTAGKL